MLEAEHVAALAQRGVAPTDDAAKYVFYETPTSRVVALFTPNGFLEEATTDAPLLGLVLEATSFYAEAGGQVADTGVIDTDAWRYPKNGIPKIVSM